MKEERTNTAPMASGCRNASCRAMPPPMEKPPTAIRSGGIPFDFSLLSNSERTLTESSTLSVDSGALGGSPVRSYQIDILRPPAKEYGRMPLSGKCSSTPLARQFSSSSPPSTNSR
eukprot:CAMPEP_0197687396 /NCGR_PEP_ID=MMETSP1338-20131121/103919_1 /TAXON_ID=43686 ORGANISM="Pelagodinium beii, Strain RCC1491" /NCGR_SAMPLE_ID=MMETSP1338 /ASSEMBLY_ACC=CAM_ASM_000754 /LENGTH=115 /DNA_ID=CAMNT_0043269479 /DNA_START=135 /DNA_END=482 /DNA_ORIENTATION=-